MKAEMLVRLSNLTRLQDSLMESIAAMIYDDGANRENPTEQPVRVDGSGWGSKWVMTKAAAEETQHYLEVWIEDCEDDEQAEEANQLFLQITEVVEGEAVSDNGKAAV